MTQFWHLKKVRINMHFPLNLWYSHAEHILDITSPSWLCIDIIMLFTIKLCWQHLRAHCDSILIALKVAIESTFRQKSLEEKKKNTTKFGLSIIIIVFRKQFNYWMLVSSFFLDQWQRLNFTGKDFLKKYRKEICLSQEAEQNP